MLAVGAASAAGTVAASAGSAAFSRIAGEIFGSFNPKYKKLDRKRMRYIQSKYAIAYRGNGDNDCNEVITSIGWYFHGYGGCLIVLYVDNDSKLKMTDDGMKPANPFADERAFDDALVMNFYPVPGHQGKFCASHAKAALGVIIEYQNQRRWVRCSALLCSAVHWVGLGVFWRGCYVYDRMHAYGAMQTSCVGAEGVVSWAP